MTLYAWIGRDETGREPGLGLKQALTPAGFIPLVSCRPGQLEQGYILEQLQAQASKHGKTIRLVRFVVESIEMKVVPR